MIDFSEYHFLYNADAHFKALERFGDAFYVTLLSNTIGGFNALCWGLAETSMQGELARRYQGFDKGKYLTEEKVRNMLSISDIPEAVKLLIGIINDGMGIESEDEEEIDEVLAELQKKTEANSQELNISTSLLD